MAEPDLMGEQLEAQFAMWDALASADPSAPQKWEEAIAREVRETRLELGWSQHFAVERLKATWGIEMHQTTLAKLEAAKRPFTLAELYAISTTYGLSPSSMLERAARTREIGESVPAIEEFEGWYARERAAIDASVTESARMFEAAIRQTAARLAMMYSVRNMLESSASARANLIAKGADRADEMAAETVRSVWNAALNRHEDGSAADPDQ